MRILINNDVRLNFNLRYASNRCEAEKCVNAYFYNEKFIADGFLRKENLPEELKDININDRYIAVFHDKDFFLNNLLLLE